ncbi:uncharacterized protein BCR38DRAFT_413371 [Pseudomassariella vexata]|uniref:Uncharacterized protein n=1 Tax=Pseudomassariella vexata TaxID=1141098 RepID=A0A1Y2DGY5_9PEZI|nr:uncharacterized protein BCR38DRAFT_413371 [Pseudomassariella vexata]ORY58519.1 hypothetical protein BCR38DRAFT_413371 [Pseudomassariella vexata]
MASPRTLLGPLTTTWTPPPVCSYAMALGCATCSTGWQGQTCNEKSLAHDYTDCWPPRSSKFPDPGVMMGWGFYSPGIACPVGYTTAAIATQGGKTGWGLEFSMTEGETAAACCPSGFSPSSIETLNTYAATCIVVATQSSFSTVVCDSGSFTDFSVITIPNNDLSSFTVYAPLFQLNFQASDIPAPSTTTPSEEPTSTSQTVPTSTTASAASSTSDPVASLITVTASRSSSGSSGAATASPNTDDEGGLSTSAKIGIGVSVAVGAIIGFAVFFLWVRSRRRSAETEPAGKLSKKKKKPDVSGSGGDEEEPSIQELDGHKVHELGAASLSVGALRQPVALFELEGTTPVSPITPNTPMRDRWQDQFPIGMGPGRTK